MTTRKKRPRESDALLMLRDLSGGPVGPCFVHQGRLYVSVLEKLAKQGLAAVEREGEGVHETATFTSTPAGTAKHEELEAAWARELHANATATTPKKETKS